MLLHLVRSMYPEVPGVFSDTGLEYPEIKAFVKTVDNVIWLKPSKTFVEVVRQYGYPVISKDVAQKIYQIRHTRSNKLRDKRLYGDDNGNGKLPEKWRWLLDAPFEISHKCCYHLKKSPFAKYERSSERKALLGTMAEESSLRQVAYIRNGGCNAFSLNRPASSPLAFWTTADIWEYIHKYGLEYCGIYDKGAERTGCMWCMFGAHMENEPNRFQRMRVTHPKIHQYCIDKLGLGEVLDYINVPYA